MTHKKFAFRYEDLAALFGFRLMKTVRESSPLSAFQASFACSVVSVTLLAQIMRLIPILFFAFLRIRSDHTYLERQTVAEQLGLKAK